MRFEGESSKWQRSAILTAFTFFAVCGSMVLVGVVIVPVVIAKMEHRYLLIQAEINARQARSYARFVQSRLTEGIPLPEIEKELQSLLRGGDADLGYSCVVNRKNAEYVCHPMAQAIGMSVAVKKAAFARVSDVEEQTDREPWEVAISRGTFGSGTLLYPDARSEIVHMEGVPGTDWTISTHENTARVQAELTDLRDSLLLGAGFIGLLLAVPSSLAARVVSRRHEKRIEAERARSERLLLNILPPPIANRLKADEQTIADRHSKVTVLFADIVGFTPMAAQNSAEDLVIWLNQVFSRFDDICAAHGLEKIKTIGDAYMLCGGLEGNAEEAAVRVIEAGLEMIQALDQFPQQNGGPSHQLRIGVHTGELVAGVIGKRKFSYDVWGDVVNTASRLESNGVPGRIQISEETAALVAKRFSLEKRGPVSIKGKGDMELMLIAEA